MKNIILGITGSVAAIKTKNLVELLCPHANIRLVMTQQSEYFIKSEYKALEQLGLTIYRDQEEWPRFEGKYQVDTPILHIEMRRWADYFVVAPLDANTLAKMSNGICDNLLTSIFRAWDWSKPVLLCPAMNTMMWNNNPTATQLELLQSWGAHIIDPIEKKLACNDVGVGAMASVEAIAQRIFLALDISF